VLLPVVAVSVRDGPCAGGVFRLRGGGGGGIRSITAVGGSEEGKAGMEGESSDAGPLPSGATEEGGTAPGKVRKKMAVGEGRSLMHWLNQRPNVKRQRWVTMDEVKTHNTASDAWTVFRGKVYHFCVCLRARTSGTLLEYFLLCAYVCTQT
jgi:hypothetical protein